MSKKVFYCIPTYKSFDHAYDGVLAALRGTRPPDQIAIIDNSGTGVGTQHLMPLTQKFSNVYILPQSYNIGVAKSWNTFFANYPDDYVINANDDVMVDPYTIERIVDTAERNPQQIFFSGDGESGNAFSLFLLTRRGYDLIGAFDEKFYPAYFEDNDYARRMFLKGYNIVPVKGATYRHIGSSTIKRYTPQEWEMHHNAHRANERYYIAKWGGMPHNEYYDTPFNM